MPAKEYEVSYPQGGKSVRTGGSGIFIDQETGSALEIWVDSLLPDRVLMIAAIEREGGEITPHHDMSSLLILHPKSVAIFDMYCHPAWLKQDARAQLRRDGEPQWTKKVILKSGWVKACLAQERFLGYEDDWELQRVGGPPASMIRSSASSVPTPVRQALPAPIPNIEKTAPTSYPGRPDTSSNGNTAGPSNIAGPSSRPGSASLSHPIPKSPIPRTASATPTRAPGQTKAEAILTMSDEEEDGQSSPPLHRGTLVTVSFPMSMDQADDAPGPSNRGRSPRPPSESEADGLSDESLISILQDAHNHMDQDLAHEDRFGEDAMQEFGLSMGTRHGTFDRQTWIKLYCEWRERRGRFAHLAKTPLSTPPRKRPAPDSTTERDSGRPLKRMTGSAGNFHHDLEEEEEEEVKEEIEILDEEESMARVVAGKWPERMEENDWRGYKTSTGVIHTPESLMGYYRKHRDLIDDMAKVLHDTGQVQSRSQYMKRSSISMVTSTLNTTESEDEEMDDEEEEEVEEQVKDGGTERLESMRKVGGVRKGYSAAEEKEIAKFVATKLPDGPSKGDWRFCTTLPDRSAGGLAERYRLKKPQFLAMAKALVRSSPLKPFVVIESPSKQPERSHITGPKYTEAEERQMAEFLNSRLPLRTTTAEDWAGLSPSIGRTSSALAQNYRTFKDLIDGYAREMRGVSSMQSSSPRPRDANSLPKTSSPLLPKKTWVPYTQKEYDEMAAYVYSRLPEETTRIERDWQDFVSSTGRTAAAVSQKFSSSQEIILDLVEKLKARDGTPATLPKRPRPASYDISTKSLYRYSEEEYKEMAAYVWLRLPKVTTPAIGDWEDFVSSTGRTTTAIAQKFASVQEHILEMVEEMKNGKKRILQVELPVSKSPAKSGPRGTMIKYTKEEYREMAIYIYNRLPAVTDTALSGWKDFVSSSGRTPNALCQKFAQQRERILKLVEKLKKQPGRAERWQLSLDGHHPHGSAKTTVTLPPKYLPYTEEEQMEMAAFINGRLPEGTGKKAWVEFPSKHGRTWRALSQHYYSNRALIDGYARDLRGEGAGSSKSAPSGTASMAVAKDISTAEEDAMAKYIALQILPREVVEDNWSGFDAMDGAVRSSDEYWSHYQAHRDRIDAKAREHRIEFLAAEMSDEDYENDSSVESSSTSTQSSATLTGRHRHLFRSIREKAALDAGDIDDTESETEGGAPSQSKIVRREITDEEVMHMVEAIAEQKRNKQDRISWTDFSRKFSGHTPGTYQNYYKKHQQRLDELALASTKAFWAEQRKNYVAAHPVGKRNAQAPFLGTFDPERYKELKKDASLEGERRMADFILEHPPDKANMPNTRCYWLSYESDKPREYSLNRPLYYAIYESRIREYVKKFKSGDRRYVHPEHLLGDSAKPFSDTEERSMAMYIAGRQPQKKTAMDMMDWRDYSRKVRHRTVIDLMAHYHEHQDRIDALVAQTVPGWIPADRTRTPSSNRRRHRPSTRPQLSSDGPLLAGDVGGAVIGPLLMEGTKSRPRRPTPSASPTNNVPNGEPMTPTSITTPKRGLHTSSTQDSEASTQSLPDIKPVTSSESTTLKMRPKFTHAEEVIMARHVAENNPSTKRTMTEADWAPHAEKHPKRTARAFHRRYLKNREAINQLAKNIRYRDERRASKQAVQPKVEEEEESVQRMVVDEEWEVDSDVSEED